MIHRAHKHYVKNEKKSIRQSWFVLMMGELRIPNTVCYSTSTRYGV
jgi:hypothetical protein